MSSHGAPSSAPPSAPSRRQKRMGPAPFASFEDLSDELDSPEDKNASGSVVRLPGIREDVTPCSPLPQSQIKPEFVYSGISLIGAPSTPTVGSAPTMTATTPLLTGTRVCLQAPGAPRIDISRASSSSHHDSKDSSPEREATNPKLALGFREEGTVELRSSTEEIHYQEHQKAKVRAHSPVLHDESYHSHNRKDSQSSEIGLLCISGRTSRLSSIGSQGSAQSRVSNASHLSVISGQSGVSRSPSPHKMLLETSFCGTKPQKKTTSADKDEGTKDDMEKVLLKRKHDPTQALIAEGITVETPKPPPEKPARRIEKEIQKVKSDVTIRVDKPTNDVLTPKLPKHIVADSGIEYIYIPLKGPMPEDTKSSSNGAITKSKVRETKSASLTLKTPLKEHTKQKSKSASPSPVVNRHHPPGEPQYIRIKLKPDHMYDETNKTPERQKPDSLDLNETPKKPPQSFEQIMSLRTESPQFITPTASPKLTCHLKEPPTTSKSPSPSLSRKSSFASIFKSRETISPESPITSHRRKNTPSGVIKDAGDHVRERRRSRSKSRDRTSLGPSSTESIDSKGRPKSVFSLFKSKKSSQRDLDTASPELPNLEGLVNVEFKFNNEPPKRSPKPLKYHDTLLDGDSVRIPLHSPTYYEQKNLLQEFKSSSQDSQETVIEVATKASEKTIESNTTVQNNTRDYSSRQSSTSSENLVFSTRLGSNNDLFTTKLPKDKFSKRTTDEVTTVIVEAPKSPPQESIKEETIKEEETKSSPEEVSVTTPMDEILVAKTKMVDRAEDRLSKPTMVSIEAKQVTPTKSEIRKFERKSSVKKREVPDIPKPKEETPVAEKKSANGVKPKVQQQPPVKPVHSRVVPPLPSKHLSREDDRYSSESERDSEVDKKEFPVDQAEATEPERKGLVLQQDSFEDEFPYIPTTLPQERSVAVPIVPVKQRSTFEMKTCPIERPRSTTPIHPTCLEDYCEEVMGGVVSAEKIAKTIEKLKISLPKDEEKPKARSPRRTGSGNWFDFSKINVSPQQEAEPPPPPLPPKGAQREWINFEEIPERRKAPKRIQTIPSRSNIEVPETVLQENVIYTYVNPEDCKCECHERSPQLPQPPPPPDEEVVREDELPLLEDDAVEEEKATAAVERIKLDVTILDRRSVVSDSSVDLSTNVDHLDANGIDHSLRTPFTSDLGISSNRSSIISQDDAQSPDTDSPNAFPKAT